MIIIPYSLQFIQSGDFECTLKNTKENSHLIWNWNIMHMYNFVYMIFTLSLVFICIYGFPTKKQGIKFGVYFAVTYVLSRLIYPQKVVGALWCFYAIFILSSYYLSRIK